MVIDYKVTGKCNSNCRFCWDFCKSVQESTPSDIENALKKLVGIVDIISLTGGEPLVAQNIVSIIKCIRNLGFRIYLSTNGILLNRYLDDIGNNVDIIGLPIDTSDRDTQAEMGRPSSMLAMTMDNIRNLKRRYPQITIKVGTVATSMNISQLVDLGHILFCGTYPPDYWRVYQFTAYGNAVEVKDIFHLGNDEFKNLENKLTSEFGNRVSFLESEEPKKSYWFITPDLKLAKLGNNNALICGDLSTMSSEEIMYLLNSNRDILINSEKNRKHLF